MWFIDVEVEQETSAPPPKKNPGSAPGLGFQIPGTGFRILCHWNLDSGFQWLVGFWIP